MSMGADDPAPSSDEIAAAARELCEWASRGGASFPKVVVGPVPGMGVGGLAKEDISRQEAGGPVVLLPSCFLMTAEGVSTILFSVPPLTPPRPFKDTITTPSHSLRPHTQQLPSPTQSRAPL